MRSSSSSRLVYPKHVLLNLRHVKPLPLNHVIFSALSCSPPPIHMFPPSVLPSPSPPRSPPTRPSQSPPPRLRRSPTLSSPASPSQPPGFAPKPRASPPIRDPYKRRIARGPDLSANFSRRVEYQRSQRANLRSSASPPPVSNVPAFVAPSAPNSSPNWSPQPLHACPVSSEIDRLFADPHKQEILPPLSPRLSFDDFARRLAADAAKPIADSPSPSPPSFSANSPEAHFTHFKQPAPSISIALPIASSPPIAASPPSPLPSAPQDTLAKWFGSIAASKANPSLSPQLPVQNSPPSVHPDHVTLHHAKQKNARDELDPNVLSFFDSIRDQALSEGQNHHDNNSHSKSDPLRIPSPSVHQPSLPASETNTVLHSSPQPVYTSQTNPHRSPPSGSSVYLNSEQLQSVSSDSRPHSDVGDLERWFAALAATNALE